MKLAIVGSRSITKVDLSPYIAPNVDTIISGGAQGVDTEAEAYADKHGLSKYILRPFYNQYGRAAPLKRNERIVEMADEVLIIWDGISKGTAYTLNYAKKAGKTVHVVCLSGNQSRHPLPKKSLPSP